MHDEQQIPVTLLTGFLGSGKTTILNRLLKHPSFGRAAVIVNEFGEIGLDHDLVVSSTENVVLLQSGCMCCALRGDLVETLYDMSERLDAGEFELDRIVIETTGLADPAPILHTLLTDRYLAERFVTDGVVTCIDAATGVQTLTRHEDARRQAGVADLLLLTKTDLPEAQEEEVCAALSAINPGAPVLRVVAGEVHPARLIGLGHFDLSMKSDEVADWMRQEATPAPAHRTEASHDADIRSVSWVVEQPLTADQFDFWMDLVMAQRGEDLLRFKALVHLTDVPFPFVVHGVQHIFHPPLPLKDWQGDDPRTKIVMIVRGFTAEDLHQLFGALSKLATTSQTLPAGYLSAEVCA